MRGAPGILFFREQDRQVTVLSIHGEFERIRPENNSRDAAVGAVINRHPETGPGSDSNAAEVARVNEKSVDELAVGNLKGFPSMAENGAEPCP